MIPWCGSCSSRLKVTVVGDASQQPINGFCWDERQDIRQQIGGARRRLDLLVSSYRTRLEP